MVLNHIYSRRGDEGGIEYFWPHEVDNTLTSARRRRAANAGARRAAPTGTAVDYEGVGTMSKSKNNGVDPQDADRPLRRRHRAPVRDVRHRRRSRRSSGTTPASKARTASCAGSGPSVTRHAPTLPACRGGGGAGAAAPRSAGA
jgi:hypothetical protein